MQLARVNGGRIHVAQACMERPVICSIHNSGSTLLFDRAVSTEQINHSLQLAADSCGLLAPIASHDIKRGFVRDYTFGPVIPGVARPDVAYMARHSESSRLAGVTQGYVGPDNVAGFKSRAVNQYEDVHGVGGEFGNKFARIPYQKRKLRPEEIDDEIKDGEDVHDKKARQRASTRIHKRLRVEFSGEQGMNSQSHRASKFAFTSAVICQLLIHAFREQNRKKGFLNAPRCIQYLVKFIRHRSNSKYHGYDRNTRCGKDSRGPRNYL